MPDNKKILLKVENVGISFNGKSLVRDVSLEVKQGEIVTLIGPNGSGKSTTAKIALGIYKKIDGKVKTYTGSIRTPGSWRERCIFKYVPRAKSSSSLHHCFV